MKPTNVPAVAAATMTARSGSGGSPMSGAPISNVIAAPTSGRYWQRRAECPCGWATRLLVIPAELTEVSCGGCGAALTLD